MLDPVEPVYNPSRPDGQLKLTTIAFSSLWISMLAFLVTVPTVTQNSLHLLSTSCVIACHLLDFVVQGKITGRRTDNASGRHPIGTPSSRHFYVECPFCHNPASLSGLGPGVFADAEPSVSKH